MSDDTAWLDQTQLYDWMHLTGALTQLPAVIDAQLRRDSGLNFFEYSVLAALTGAPRGALQLATLARLTHGSQSRLSHAITRMEHVGWVERRSCTAGPRTVEAMVTPAGRSKLTEAAPHHVREVRRMVIDVLTAEELDELARILRKVLHVTSPGTLALIDAAFTGHQDDLRIEHTPAPDECRDACTTEPRGKGGTGPGH